MSLEKKPCAKKLVVYVVGSLALFAAACVVIPMIMPNISGKIYKESVKRSNKKAEEDDDWGPVMEKKNKSGNN